MHTCQYKSLPEHIQLQLFYMYLWVLCCASMCVYIHREGVLAVLQFCYGHHVLILTAVLSIRGALSVTHWDGWGSSLSGTLDTEHNGDQDIDQ